MPVDSSRHRRSRGDIGSATTTPGTIGSDASQRNIDSVDRSCFDRHHGLSVGTAEQASVALDAIDEALKQVNSARGTLGAVQSRFENAIASIQVTSENIAAARGRIVDADFAQETSNLSRAQILQQAGTAMVSQANQLPQQVLSLLR